MQLGYKITNQSTSLTKIIAFKDYAPTDLLQILVFYRGIGFRVEITAINP